ncbi:MAG: CoA pyrophosphatase [Deltaproteobacteria bacterium]|nr:CoA pyrophosphatase [Deltaproteobacteria bacterium]
MNDAIDSFKVKVRKIVEGDRVKVDRDELTPAAVLVPFVFRDGEPRLIFTKRTMNVAKHKGQISFPGGMAEPEDDGPVATALREAQEEIGLDPTLVEVVGTLDDQITVTGFVVTPVIGFVDADAAISPDPVEVEELFEVSVDVLRDPARSDVGTVDYRGVSVETQRYFTDGGRVIWGATARIVARFLAALDEVAQ